jgi:hypothetical protein
MRHTLWLNRVIFIIKLAWKANGIVQLKQFSFCCKPKPQNPSGGSLKPGSPSKGLGRWDGKKRRPALIRNGYI